MITIIDYGMGNLGSIVNMLKKIGVPAQLSSDPAIIAQAKKLILPGVGAFDHGMKSLEERNLIDVLNEKVLHQKTPLLGLCLGVQLFARRSEEGQCEGLGWLDADVVQFKFDGASRLKVPHMGWNYIDTQQDDPLFKEMNEETRFYFVHGYHLQCDDPQDVLATTEYGYAFPSIVGHNNILGAQFHPEKSHKHGMQLFHNFVEYY